MSTGASRVAWLAFAAVCLFWGTTYLGIKIALETVPPFLMGGLRFSLAGILLALWLRVRGHAWPELRRAPVFLLVGLLMLAFGNGGVVWAEQYMASGLVAILVASVPFWMVGIEALAGGDRLTRGVVGGLLVGFSGILLLVWRDLRDALTATAGWGWVGGLIATQLACVGWALGSTVQKRRLKDLHPLVSAAFQMLAGGVVMLAIAAALGEFGRLTWTGRSVGAFVYLLVAGSLVGYVAYTYALAHLPISIVSLYPYINPLVAVLLGTWLLGEPLTWRIASAIALILTGSAIVSRSRMPAARTVVDAPPSPTAAEGAEAS